MKNSPNTRKPSISFFCPAYNDDGSLPILIPKTHKILTKICKKFEIAIINDASPDRSGVIAEKLAKKYSPQVKVLHHEKNRGYGGALLSGFQHANKYEYLFYTDGDSQYDVNVITEMIKHIGQYDAVVGKRRTRELAWQRKFQSIFYNGLLKLLFNLKNDDVNCAIRLIKRSTIDELTLTSKSAFLPAETLIELQKHKAKVKSIEVTHYPRIHGKASGGKLSVIIPTFIDMLKY